jgi:NADPH:quinone reductase-like Zn-dependent oxidoreductase
VAEVARPEPKKGEVRIRIHAAAVTRSDCATRDANRKGGALVTVISRLISGPVRPRQPILGSEFAGTVEAIGPVVHDLGVGDDVFGSSGFRFGAHAEFLCLPESARIARMPSSMRFEEAAAVTDGGLNALWCFKVAGLGSQHSILVYGASGAIGTAGVQLARARGAHVTAVCSTPNLALVKSLGADTVLDYTREDFLAYARAYDFIFDAVGKLSFRRCKGSLKPGGSYLATDGLSNLLLALWTPRSGGKKVQFAIPPRTTKRDVQFLKELIEAGQFRPVLDRSYPMDDVVGATRYVETEQKVGNVILTIDGAGPVAAHTRGDPDTTPLPSPMA